MHFPCIQCGLCCRVAGMISELKVHCDEDGVCKHLKDDICEIYNTRPSVCDIERTYRTSFHEHMSEKMFILSNLQVCYELNLTFGSVEGVEQLKRIMDNLS
jgi:hypothetical protein